MKRKKRSSNLLKYLIGAGGLLVGLVALFYVVNFPNKTPRELTEAEAVAQTGQIIVDPEHPGRMIYKGVFVDGKPKPVILCGPGDPEDFFYNDTSNNFDLLVDRKANTNYIQAYHVDFCQEEDKNCYPGEHMDFDEQLDIWESWISQMEAKNITTVFFLFDDHYIPPGGWENFDWQTPVGKIIDKFKHHKLLIWVVAEEYSEGPGFEISKSISEFIKARDEYNHVVGVHQMPNYWPDLESGWKFDFKDVSTVDMFLMQYNEVEVWKMYNRVVKAWNYVSGNKIVNMSENIHHAQDSRAVVRKRNWAAIMGGASMVMVHEMGRKSDPVAWNYRDKYDDCEILTNFFEASAVNQMIPDNANRAVKTLYLLSDQPNSYIAYGIGVGASNSEGIGIRNMVAGSYSLKWLEIPSGQVQTQYVKAISGENRFTRPATFTSGEVALYLRRVNPVINTIKQP